MASDKINSVHFRNEKHLIDENQAIDMARKWMKEAEEARKSNVAFQLTAQHSVSYQMTLLGVPAYSVYWW